MLLGGVLGMMMMSAIYLISNQKAPADRTQVPVSTVAWSIKGVHTIENLEARLRMAPEDTGSRVQLADAYLREARQSLQEAYYLPLAQEQLDVVFAQEAGHFQARALQASLYNTLHQFEKARDVAMQLVAESPGTAYVYGILIDALVELGAYEEAVQRCDEMLRLRPGLASYSRAAYLRELHGDTEGAIEAMTLAAEAGVTGEIDRSWALFQLGQLYLAENDVDAAAALFEGILEETPYYAYAIGGMAQVMMQRGDYARAIDGFKEAYALVPADAFLEGLVEMYTLQGNAAQVEVYRQQLQQGYMDAADMGENVRMEYADFLADGGRQLEKALELAQMEYERRPGHLHALETYAWALHKNGRSAEAIPYIEQAMRLNTGDAMVYFRAGEIYSGAGFETKAAHYFDAALDANLHIESLSSAEMAKKIRIQHTAS